ncbi:hypothetical protein E4U37_002152, partial [Claviceps purpurea]
MPSEMSRESGLEHPANHATMKKMTHILLILDALCRLGRDIRPRTNHVKLQVAESGESIPIRRPHAPLEVGTEASLWRTQDALCGADWEMTMAVPTSRLYQGTAQGQTPDSL